MTLLVTTWNLHIVYLLRYVILPLLSRLTAHSTCSDTSISKVSSCLRQE
jgi:hypothetical protein